MNPKHELSDDSAKKGVRGWIRSLHEPSSMRFLAWYVLIGTPLALLLYGAFPIFSEMQTFNTLKSTGNRANATITNNRTTANDETTAYYITYEFTAVDDQRYVREQEVSGATYNAMGIGTTLEVIYDKNNPVISRLSNFDAPNVTRLIYGLIITVPFLFWIILSRLRSRKRQSA